MQATILYKNFPITTKQNCVKVLYPNGNIFYIGNKSIHSIKIMITKFLRNL